MTLSTLIEYLVGNRDAMRSIASDPWALWVGLALTLSTGLARSWATHDLRRQPWRVLLPPVVALVLSGVLYAAIWMKAGGLSGLVGYRSVAALVLLTAPLAWLYAIPYERFVSPFVAVALRLGTLAVVATWRVVLVSIALSVLLKCDLLTSGSLVLGIAAAAMVVGIVVPWWFGHRNKDTTTPMLLGVMSGITAPNLVPNPARKLLVNVSAVVAVVGGISVPFLLSRASDGTVDARVWRELLAEPNAEAPSASLWLLAAGAIAFFAALLPWGQSRPRLRTLLTKAFGEGRIAEGIRLLSAHQPNDLMPGWVPPPEGDFRDPPRFLDVMDAVIAVPATGWVRELYLERFRAYLAEPLWYWYYDSDLERIGGLLTRLPDGRELAQGALAAGHAFEQRHPFLGLRQSERDEKSEVVEHADPLLERVLFPEPEITPRREEIIAELRRIADRGS